MHDMLLQIDTYAEPTPSPAIDQAVAFAKVCGGRISALATHIDIHVPDNWLAEKLLHVSHLAKVEEDKSLQAARSSLRYFEDAARKADVFSEAMVARVDLNAIGPCVARHARTRDLCIASFSNRIDSQRAVAEDVVFGSGRPVLVFNPDKAPLPTGSLTSVSVLWDGSRCAARAVSDSIPILAKAQKVSVVTVIGEKPSAVSGLAADLVRHLGTHGIAVQIEEVTHRGSIGASIEAHLTESRPDILIMGAYGTPKLKEFILGGATEHVLNNLRVPVILSH
jgi:nucleotide-binding universal stress UspA family protein